MKITYDEGVFEELVKAQEIIGSFSMTGTVRFRASSPKATSNDKDNG